MLRNGLAASLALLIGCAGQGDTSDSSNVEASGSTTNAGTDEHGATQATEPGPDASAGAEAPVDAPCEVGEAPAVWVGHGDGGFAELSEHPAEIVYGVQGGFHIVLGLHAQHIDASDLAVARLRGLVDGVEVGRSSPYADFACRGDTLEALGLFLIWDRTPDELHQQTVQIEVELTDAAGTVSTAAGEVVVVDPMQT